MKLNSHILCQNAWQRKRCVDMVELVKELTAKGYLPSLIKTVQTLIFRESWVKYENLNQFFT